MIKKLIALLLLVLPCVAWGQGSKNYPASIDSKTCSNSEEFYPRESRQLNQQGTVVLRFDVEADGRLAQVEVERSSGFERLDLAARLLLYSCKFKPGMVNGKPEKTSATLEVIWKLDQTESNRLSSQQYATYPASIDRSTCSNSDVFYPRQSRQLNETGVVLLRFFVRANGSLSSVEVEKSSGYRRLDQAARKLLETCKFKPGMVSGKIEESSGTHEVIWKLDESTSNDAFAPGSVTRLPPCPPKGPAFNCFGRLINGYDGVYVGEIKNNLEQGMGILYSQNGEVSIAGRWEEGRFTESVSLSTIRFPFTSPFLATPQLSTDPSKTEYDQLAAEVEAERKRREELEMKLAEAEAKEREQRTPTPQTQVASPRNPHALIIGNSAYPGSARLDNPINDANAVAQKLKAMGSTVTVVTDSNRQRLVQAMSNFRKTASSADLSLLFYSGHGVQIFGTNYILPTDADQTDVAQATMQGISLNSVVENFLPGKTKIVFLDACRDNPLQRAGDRTVSKGLAPISVAQGTLIAYATKDGQTASDGVGQKNSPFTKALLEHLSDPQDIAVILRKVREKVMTATGGKQQPWEYGSLTGGELVLSGVKR
jgi:TonB family protein